jgi:hypothetical protein
MYVGSVQQVKTASVQSNISKTTIDSMSPTASMGGGSFQINSISDLLGPNSNGTNTVLTQKSSSYPNANAGSNPSGAVDIGGSKSIGLYNILGFNKVEFSVYQIKNLIDKCG